VVPGLNGSEVRRGNPGEGGVVVSNDNSFIDRCYACGIPGGAASRPNGEAGNSEPPPRAKCRASDEASRG
jgi:hypothetical protein